MSLRREERFARDLVERVLQRKLIPWDTAGRQRAVDFRVEDAPTISLEVKQITSADLRVTKNRWEGVERWHPSSVLGRHWSMTQSSVTVDLDDPLARDRAMGYIGGLYQEHAFGSDAHYDSMRRRSYVESAFANIKNEAEQSLQRPSMRVMGRAKMTLMSMIVAAAANLRMGRVWTRRQHRARTAAGGVAGPVISPAMVAASRAQQRAEARRQRRAEEREQERIAAKPSSRQRPPPEPTARHPG